MSQMRKLPLSEQIHVAWYCLRGMDRRFEEAEADFIRRLDEMGLPVIVVLTQVPFRDGQYHPDALMLAEQIMAKRLPIAGSRPFLKRVSVERHQDPGGEIPIRQRLGRPPLTEILGDAVSRSERDLRIRAAVLEHRYTQASVAKASRLSRNTVSRIVRATSQPSAFSGLMVQRET